MAKCKAIKGNGEQCQREARDGMEYCAIPAHAALEEAFVAEVIAEEKDRYKILILNVGSKSQKPHGYSGKEVVALLNDYYKDGYELLSVESAGLVEMPGSSAKEHLSVMYTLKLRE